MARPSKPEVPAFQSDRMRLLGPLITPRVMEIAYQRLMSPRPRLDTMEDAPSVLRLAAIVLLEMNPAAYLTNEEEAIRRGVDADTVGKMKSRGEI